MALKLYASTSTDDYLDTSLSRQALFGNNRRMGEPTIKKLWVRNDSTSMWYSNVKIWATSDGVDITSGTNGFGVKFYIGELEPTERLWGALPYNEPGRMPTIGTSGTASTAFYPLWVRWDMAPGADVGAYEASLIIGAIENNV